MPYNGRMVFAEKTKRVLCFEYMHNGSLGNFIYGMICGTLLVLGGSNLRNNLTHTLMMILVFFSADKSNRHNWRTRYAIIKGICEGLEYLHEKLEPSMYHLDLKPANVLLDENMSAKIADFGVSRLFLEEKTRKTNSVLGTL
jgi:serine/threonine protein kinase